MLVYTHRWMGIVLGVLFVAWFASGIVMMYARMPELSGPDRLARLPAIVPETVRVAPPLPADAEITRLVMNTIETRPVFRITAKGRTSCSLPIPAIRFRRRIRSRRFVLPTPFNTA